MRAKRLGFLHAFFSRSSKSILQLHNVHVLKLRHRIMHRALDGNGKFQRHNLFQPACGVHCVFISLLFDALNLMLLGFWPEPVL